MAVIRAGHLMNWSTDCKGKGWKDDMIQTLQRIACTSCGENSLQSTFFTLTRDICAARLNLSFWNCGRELDSIGQENLEGSQAEIALKQQIHSPQVSSGRTIFTSEWWKTWQARSQVNLAKIGCVWNASSSKANPGGSCRKWKSVQERMLWRDLRRGSQVVLKFGKKKVGVPNSEFFWSLLPMYLVHQAHCFSFLSHWFFEVQVSRVDKQYRWLRQRRLIGLWVPWVRISVVTRGVFTWAKYGESMTFGG